MLDFLFRPIRFQSLVLPHQSNLPSTFRTSSTGTHNLNYICNAIVSPTNRFLINLIRSQTHPIFFLTWYSETHPTFRNPSQLNSHYMFFSLLQLVCHHFSPPSPAIPHPFFTSAPSRKAEKPKCVGAPCHLAAAASHLGSPSRPAARNQSSEQDDREERVEEDYGHGRWSAVTWHLKRTGLCMCLLFFFF